MTSKMKGVFFFFEGYEKKKEKIKTLRKILDRKKKKKF